MELSAYVTHLGQGHQGYLPGNC